MGGKRLKVVSVGSERHAQSRSRIFAMKTDGRDGDIEVARWGVPWRADGLTLQCHPESACFGRVHVPWLLACLSDPVSAGLGIIKFDSRSLLAFPSGVPSCPFRLPRLYHFFPSSPWINQVSPTRPPCTMCSAAEVPSVPPSSSITSSPPPIVRSVFCSGRIPF